MLKPKPYSRQSYYRHSSNKMLAGARSTSVPGIWAVFRSDHWREAMRTTNLFILRGYVGQEPKAFDNGKIAKVSVATNRSWTDKKSRERIEKTDWITVTVLNERDAAFALKNVRKGAPIYAGCRVAETSYEKCRLAVQCETLGYGGELGHFM
jgi:single-strand DNA-binding protein